MGGPKLPIAALAAVLLATPLAAQAPGDPSATTPATAPAAGASSTAAPTSDPSAPSTPAPDAPSVATPSTTAAPTADSATATTSTPSAAPAESRSMPDATPAASAGATGQPAATETPAASPSPGDATAAAPAPPPPPPEPTLLIKADLGSQQVTVIENGKAKYTWPISSGMRGYPTKTGTFTPQWTDRMHYSRQWDWAPMPYAVFFNKGTAFHATTATRSLGRPASHGCVRLSHGNAKTLYRLVHQHGLALTRVVVYGSPKFKEPAVARRRAPLDAYASNYRRPRYSRYTYNYPYDEGPRRRRFVNRRGSPEPLGGWWD